MTDNPVENSESKESVADNKKYWYATDIYTCVLCGKETKYKERVHDESKKGTNWHDDMCWEHKI